MDQPTFADLEYQGKKRKTRRVLFLEHMDGLIPCSCWRTASAPSTPGPERGAIPILCRSCSELTVSSFSTI